MNSNSFISLQHGGRFTENIARGIDAEQYE